MCGVAGIVATEARRYSEPLQRMVNSIGHRGPDGSGIHFFNDCALGHRRLSTVDLDTGAQPMLSSVADVGITFNGEIYGYNEVRSSLSDYAFRTVSDTEVILALYHKYGKDLLQHLPGMFAFAIWDNRHRELFCARDRFGEKPFYYAFGRNGEFLFASEIKALLATGLVRPVLNKEAVVHYLKYLYVHPYQTIYKNIFTIPPGHFLHYYEGRVSLEHYWRLPETKKEIELSDAVEEFKRLLDRSVARQLVADVPVGAFLSGGLDSSTIVAVASRHKAGIKTFSFDFEGTSSELPYAREVARLYKTEHVELSDTHSDIAALLLTMQDVYDEPFADSSNIPTYLIAKLAREHVKVVLTGDGGDELMGGYPWYRSLLHMKGDAGGHPRLANLLRLAFIFARRTGLPVSQSRYHELQGRYLASKYGSVSAAHSGQKAYFTDSELANIGLKAVPGPIDGSLRNGRGDVDEAMRMDILDYMPGDILVKIDRASMSNGLELRAPFLDMDFASFCISLPYSLKITREEDKIILRRAFASYWPESLRARGKQGFGAPVKSWLKRDSVKELKIRYLNDQRSKLFSLLSFKDTRSIVKMDDYKTWILLVLALWLERHEFEME